jgi:hypothetical protein
MAHPVLPSYPYHQHADSHSYQGFKIVVVGEDDEGDEADDLTDNKIVKFARCLIPVSSEYSGSSFFTREGGRRKATPLLLVLITIELSDVVFAVDSVPAAFGVSEKPVTCKSFFPFTRFLVSLSTEANGPLFLGRLFPHFVLYTIGV